MSLLHDVVKEGKDIEGLRELLQEGRNIHELDDEGLTPLHLAARNNETTEQKAENNLQLARVLLCYGARVNMRNDRGHTPLITAVIYRNCKMIEFLVREGADINKQDYEGNAPLHHAAHNCAYYSCFGRYEPTYAPALKILKLILGFNPVIDSRNDNDETPLLLAVRAHDLVIVQELLKRNASATLRDINQNSVMHYALEGPNVNVNIVMELLRHGCRFRIRNLSGDTPITIYLRYLQNASAVEIEKSKFVLKLFVFSENNLNFPQQRALSSLNINRGFQLAHYIQYCKNEIISMKLDALAPNCFVYNMALRGFSRQIFANTHVPFSVFDEVLYRLLEGKYPVYADLIVSGICSPYMNKKFAETCCWVCATDTEFLSFDALYLLSFYLSHFDMLNMMIACSPDNRTSNSCFRQLERLANCSIL